MPVPTAPTHPRMDPCAGCDRLHGVRGASVEGFLSSDRHRYLFQSFSLQSIGSFQSGRGLHPSIPSIPSIGPSVRPFTIGPSRLCFILPFLFAASEGSPVPFSGSLPPVDCTLCAVYRTVCCPCPRVPCPRSIRPLLFSAAAVLRAGSALSRMHLSYPPSLALAINCQHDAREARSTTGLASRMRESFACAAAAAAAAAAAPDPAEPEPRRQRCERSRRGAAVEEGGGTTFVRSSAGATNGAEGRAHAKRGSKTQRRTITTTRHTMREVTNGAPSPAWTAAEPRRQRRYRCRDLTRQRPRRHPRWERGTRTP